MAGNLGARSGFVGLTLACGATLTPARVARAQTIERISVGAGGAQADDVSFLPRLSQNGRFAVFVSHASNLVAADTGGHDPDVFVRDLVTGVNELVSDVPALPAASVWAAVPAISSDGRFVAFAGNGFDPGDSDAAPDVFVRDRAAGTTLWATPWNDDVPVANFEMDGTNPILGFGVDLSAHVVDLLGGGSWVWNGSNNPLHAYSRPVVGRGGRYVALDHVSVLMPQNEFVFEILVLDTQTGSVQAVWSDPSSLSVVDVSSDRTFVLFDRFTALGDSGAAHLYALDTLSGVVRGVDTALHGGEGNEGYLHAALSGEGRYAAFTSRANDLVNGDKDFATDVFVRETRRGGSARATTGMAGAPALGDSIAVDVSFTGDRIVFDSDAGNLVAGDTNGFRDVFLRSGPFEHFQDLDGDGFGSGLASSHVLPPPAGLVLTGDDCDEGDAAIHPLAAELPCTGVDENCDGAVDETGLGSPSCIWNTSTLGCMARLELSGCASASAGSGLTVRAVGIEGQRNAMLFYGLSDTFLPFGSGSGSWLCVATPRQRMDAHFSGGTAGQCDGGFIEDLLAWIAAHPSALGTPLSAGQDLFLQAWFRDPPAPRQASLTASWEVTLLP